MESKMKVMVMAALLGLGGSVMAEDGHRDVGHLQAGVLQCNADQVHDVYHCVTGESTTTMLEKGVIMTVTALPFNAQ